MASLASALAAPNLVRARPGVDGPYMQHSHAVLKETCRARQLGIGGNKTFLAARLEAREGVFAQMDDGHAGEGAADKESTDSNVISVINGGVAGDVKANVSEPLNKKQKVEEIEETVGETQERTLETLEEQIADDRLRLSTKEIDELKATDGRMKEHSAKVRQWNLSREVIFQSGIEVDWMPLNVNIHSLARSLKTNQFTACEINPHWETGEHCLWCRTEGCVCHRLECVLV